MRHAIRGSILLALALLVAAGCGGGSGSGSSGGGSSDAPAKGGDLTVARGIDAATLDPMMGYTPDDALTINQIFEPLFIASKDGRSVIPWLAKSSQLSDGGKTLTVQLRDGVQFSDGKPLTADDVTYSLNRVVTSKTSPFGFLLAPIKSVESDGQSTVVIHLNQPWAPILADLSAWVAGIVPEDLNGESPKQFFAHPVGTGPFVLEHWAQGQEVALKRNPHYWRTSQPYIDTLTFSVVPDQNIRVSQVQGGQADIAYDTPPQQTSALDAGPGVDAKAFPADFTDFLIFNTKVKPFQDVHVRRAIGLAIDREALTNAVLFGTGTPACSLIPPTMVYADASTPCLKFDLDAAKQELAESSVPGGFKAEFTVESSPTYQSAAQIIQQQLKPLGIDVTIRVVPANQVYTLYPKGDYQFGWAGWSSDIPDPDEQMSYMLDPAAGGDAYYTGYDNKQLASLVQQAAAEQDPDKRGELYAQVQEISANEVPQTTTFYESHSYAWSSKVHDFQVNPLYQTRYDDVWIGQ